MTYVTPFETTHILRKSTFKREKNLLIKTKLVGNQYTDLACNCYTTKCSFNTVFRGLACQECVFVDQM